MVSDERTEMIERHLASLLNCDIDFCDAFLALCGVSCCELEEFDNSLTSKTSKLDWIFLSRIVRSHQTAMRLLHRTQSRITQQMINIRQNAESNLFDPIPVFVIPTPS
jgi:hypothetical protein